MAKKPTLDELDDEVAQLFEDTYKNKVAAAALLSLLLKKHIFTPDEFDDEMNEVRQRVRDN